MNRRLITRSRLILPLTCGILLSVSCGEIEKITNGEEEEKEVKAEVLRGSWLGDCLEVNSAYGRISLTFLSETLTYTSTRYSDAECTAEMDTIKGRGAYTLGSIVEANSEELTAIDFSFDDFTWKFTSEPALAVDWAALCSGSVISDGLADVLGGTCTVDSYTLNFVEKQYGSVLVKDDKLFITDITSNGSSIENRSTTLNLTTGGMTKQDSASE